MQKLKTTPSTPRYMSALVLFAGVSLISACSSSGSSSGDGLDPVDDPAPTEGPITVEDPTTIEEPVTEEDPTTIEDPVTEEDPTTIEEPVTVGSAMFPVDVDNDDRPGLIVTGLNGVDPVDLVSPWLVNAQTFRLDSITPGSGDGFVDMLRYQDDFPVAIHIDFFEQELGSCDIRDPAVPQPIDSGDGGSPPPLISGGSTVVINTPSGPWFTYEAQLNSDNGNIFYSTNDQLPGALPVGATLSIPGDAFPTVAAHPLYEPAPPVRLLPDITQFVAPDSIYSWIPENTAPAFVKLNLLAYSGDDNFFEGFFVTCYLEDDGAFTMPDEVVDYVATTPFNLEARYSRVYARLDFTNGIVIYQENEVAE